MEIKVLSQDELNYFQELTSVEIDNQICFVAEDVAHILELKDPLEVLNMLDEDEQHPSDFYRFCGQLMAAQTCP